MSHNNRKTEAGGTRCTANLGNNFIAALWGFAEATFFFIVPDVFLSVLGLRNLRRATVACLYALGGALVGGTVMYAWGLRDVNAVLAILDAIPAISPEMLSRVRRSLDHQGIMAVLIGPFLGTPYKIYAVQAAAAGIGLLPFLLISIPARLGRFLAVTICCSWIGNTVLSHCSGRSRLAILFAGWTGFYAFYFAMMPN
jgi:membrane protein YqaA with SNARE-associated domain